MDLRPGRVTNPYKQVGSTNDIVLLHTRQEYNGLRLKKADQKSTRKGKHAKSTEHRRLVWEYVVWPLILDTNRQFFTLKEYHLKRNRFCELYGIQDPSKIAGGFISLVTRGLLVKERGYYSLHYRLLPYMRKRVVLEYGVAVKEVYTKR